MWGAFVGDGCGTLMFYRKRAMLGRWCQYLSMGYGEDVCTLRVSLSDFWIPGGSGSAGMCCILEDLSGLLLSRWGAPTSVKSRVGVDMHTRGDGMDRVERRFGWGVGLGGGGGQGQWIYQSSG